MTQEYRITTPTAINAALLLYKMDLDLVKAASMSFLNARQWCRSKEEHMKGHFDQITGFNYVETMDGEWDDR